MAHISYVGPRAWHTAGRAQHTLEEGDSPNSCGPLLPPGSGLGPGRDAKMKTWPFLKEPSLVPKPGVKSPERPYGCVGLQVTTSQSCTNPEDTEQSVAVTLPRAHQNAWEHRGKRTIWLLEDSSRGKQL